MRAKKVHKTAFIPSEQAALPDSPVAAIQAIVREWYERGASSRALERFLQIEREVIDNWAFVFGWTPGERRLFRVGQDDLFSDSPAQWTADTLKGHCAALLETGLRLDEINVQTGIRLKQLHAWFSPPSTDRPQRDSATLVDVMQAKIQSLLEKTDFTEADAAQVDRLSSAIKRLQEGQAAITASKSRADYIRAKAQAAMIPRRPYCKKSDEVIAETAAPEGDDKPKEKGYKKKIINNVGNISEERLDEVRDELLMLFAYQLVWHGNRHQRRRFILKSRQIGATWYFAWEAFEDAIRTGENQIFISSSRDQALVFKDYIVMFAEKFFDLSLIGKFSIKLSNGAILRFLATNVATAQSYSGHLYIDEVFWMRDYKKIHKVAGAMASHKKWRITLFSTPSAMSHDAYTTWSGQDFAKNNGLQDFAIDHSHAALKDGLLCEDGFWRHMVTVEDAERNGCDLFDIAELKLEYSKDDFDNLFMCKFIDDSQSVFSLQQLMNCIVEGDSWKDYKDNTPRPFGNHPVSIGYDPSRVRDSASLSILSVPLKPMGDFRVLAQHSFNGQNVQYQSSRVVDIRNQHNTQFLGIDVTGIGYGVYDLVKEQCGETTPIHYSLEVKNSLVVKALDIVANGRLKYLERDHEITRAFLMITKTTTSNGQIIYASTRSAKEGHADKAWSIMHALSYEPINANRRTAGATFSH